ncbi:reducing type I polyketide synthase 10 [Hypoxylon cercidicola]|nr:reducing type I polyketide synthase 10 [Hypoxylon cercidicola]
MDTLLPEPHGRGVPTEPVAIIGMALRLPGDTSSPTDFWRMIYNGQSGQSELPASRFNIRGFYHPNGANRAGSMVMTGGYFIDEDIKAFDNAFFGINNLEATYMDPQQRKLLEVVFECFENAGIPLDKASGSNTGCFVGNFTIDFQVMQTKNVDEMHGYSATGMGTTILANRISHAFNLLGPSLVLDTACSSTLYCLHMACAALETRDCDAAIVAGANLIQSPEQHIGTMKAGVLSPTSTCHTFDASADGYGRADGIGALYLKRLSDAVRDGDPIRSIIRATAVNHNGRTQGITLPSSEGQISLMRKAYEKCGLSPEETAYVECHGTGTSVGDPIEVEAIGSFMGRPANNAVLIGGSKPNFGHSEAASSIASIIKATLMLENGYIPPTMGIAELNPKIKSDEWGIEVVTKGRPWPESISGQTTRRVSINAFGYGGANAHAILESKPRRIPEPSKDAPHREYFILPFSAATELSLEARIKDFAHYDFASTSLEDLAFTLGARRSHLARRGFLVTKKSSFIHDISSKRLRNLGSDMSTSARDLAFVFTGQGSQWKGMGKELFAEFPIFRETIAELESFLRLLPHPPLWTLSALILGSDTAVEIANPEFSQPACTAIQIGLVKLLASWGLNPSAVLGHSSGEIAAAHAAGFISATEAMRVAYYRGYVVRKYSTATGSMMAVNMSPTSFNDFISTQESRDVSIACTNSPNLITIAGGSRDIDLLQRDLQAKGVFARKLQTGGIAYHSKRMLPLGERYEHLLEPTTPRTTSNGPDTNCIWISSVTGNLLTAADIGPAYWRMNLEKPVEFATAISRLASMKKYHLIEIGPHSTLEMPIKQTLETLGISISEMPYCATIIRNENAVETVLSTVGSIFLQGRDVSFEKINETTFSHGGVSIRSPQVLVDLPRYRWTRTDQNLWNEPRESTEFRNRIHRRHELLGSVVPGGDGVEIRWKNIIRLEEIAWLNDHKLEGTVVFPAAAYIAIAIEAARQSSETRKGVIYLRNFHILAALPVPLDSSAKLELLTTLKPTRISYTTNSKSSWDISVVSIVNQVSTVHVTGIVGLAVGSIKPTITSVVSQQRLTSMSPSVWYDAMAREGLNFGPQFRTIKDLNVDPSKALRYCHCMAPVPQDTSKEDYPIHPVTIDAALQASLVAFTAGNPEALKAMVPTMIESASFSEHGSRTGTPLHIDSKAEIAGFNRSISTSEARAEMDRVVFRLDGVRLASYQAYQAAADMIPSNTRHPMLRVLWKPDIEIGLQSSSFSMSQYLEASSAELRRDFERDALRKLAGCVALFGHKNPYLRVLECRKRGQSMAKAMVKLLHGESSFPRLWSYTIGRIDDDGVLRRSEVDIKTGEEAGAVPEDEETNYDLVIFLRYDGTKEFLDSVSLGEKFIRPWGALLALLDGPLQIDWHEHKLIPISRTVTDDRTQTVVAYLRTMDTYLNPLQNHSDLYVACHQLSPLAHVVSREIRTLLGRDPQIIQLEDIQEGILPSGAIVILLLESDKPLLTSISDKHMRFIQQITDKASTLVWVTGGNLFEGGSPSHSLAAGLARAVVLEQPALRFITFDIDDVSHDMVRTARNIVHVLARSVTSGFDSEFIQRSGIVHISRFVPDDGLNASFRQRQGSETQYLNLMKAKPVQLSIGPNHQLDSIFFEQISYPHQLGSTDIEIEIEAVGLNAKDYYALTGKVDTRDATCTIEYGGVIRRIGSAVRDFSPGDRVIAMAPGKFKTHEIVPSWACQKLLPEEDMDIMCTLPVAYSTAIYALLTRANLQSGESVLIHSGAGGVGIAAIHIARQAQAEIFATVSTEEKKDYLVETFKIKREHIFSSRDVSFVEGVMNATGGRGVDVVLNSLSGELLHSSWRCCAEFGRFIEIGKRDFTEGGRLEMEQFLKSATFTGFDLSGLYYSGKPAHQKEWASLLAQVLQLYRQKKLIEFPLQRFDIGQISNAFRAFGLTSRIGKIVVTIRNSESLLNVQLPKYNTEFSPVKSYLMVGCLGGLGRCISSWMMARGARNFVFLNRSGTEKVQARELVDDLEANGATCIVVRGDVCSLEDVKVMVEKASGPIGGVIQAAMVLSETLFTNMSSTQWHKVIGPKVQGTWNLHNALMGKDGQLDFFLMLSSNSGSVGTATESNYCAGNYFLDIFARYRRSLGLPAVSLGLGMISEVGYLHDNPQIGDLLIRRGVHPLPESELLIVIDVGLSNQGLTTSEGYDYGAESHILTGLESVGLLKRRKGGFEDDDSALNDTRSRILLRALHNQRRINTDQEGNLPEEVLGLLEAGRSLADALETHISRRFSNMTLTPYDNVDVNRPLVDYGMDSMVGAELRSWLYRSLKVDVPFLDILGRSTTLSSLAMKVTEKIGHIP